MRKSVRFMANCDLGSIGISVRPLRPLPGHGLNKFATALKRFADDASNLFGEVVGGVQVLTHEAHPARDLAVHQRLPAAIGDLDLQLDRGPSADRGHLARFLAAMLES